MYPPAEKSARAQADQSESLADQGVDRLEYQATSVSEEEKDGTAILDWGGSSTAKVWHVHSFSYVSYLNYRYAARPGTHNTTTIIRKFSLALAVDAIHLHLASPGHAHLDHELVSPLRLDGAQVCDALLRRVLLPL